MSTGITSRGDVTEAASGVRTGLVRRADRRELPEHGRRRNDERELVERHVVAGVLEQSGDVVDALRVAVGPGGAVAAVRVGDRLERGLVRADAVERHAVEQLLIRVFVRFAQPGGADVAAAGTAKAASIAATSADEQRAPRCEVQSILAMYSPSFGPDGTEPASAFVWRLPSRTPLKHGLVGCRGGTHHRRERARRAVEARHRVHAVAVADGSVVESCGDPALVTFFRSSAKPIQALPVVRARPDLDDAEIAIACASHLHRPDQLAPVRALLVKAGATEDDLECGPEPTRLEHNCSGKHAAMLLLCRERGWPVEGYRLAEHPCQAEMLDEIAAAAEVEPAAMHAAIDGCGVVTYALTLERMAHAFSRLEQLDGGTRAADAMRAHPELVRGAGAPDTELMRLGDGWVAKGGAEGLLCAARDGLGIALKSEDGAQRPLAVALAAFLARLGFDAGDLAHAPVENSRGEIVGEVRALRNDAAR